MTISLGIDRLLGRRSPPDRRPPRRRGLQPGIDRQPVPSHGGPPGRGPRHHRQCDLRAAARLSIRPAGQHDRDRRTPAMRAGGCRSTRSTAKRASRRPTCCATSTCSSSICRTSARACTPTSTRWRTACAPRRATACTSSSAIGPTRSAAKRSKGISSTRRLRRSSDSSRFRCGTG